MFSNLVLPRGAQWRPVSSVEMSIGDPLEVAGMFSQEFGVLTQVLSIENKGNDP